MFILPDIKLTLYTSEDILNKLTYQIQKVIFKFFTKKKFNHLYQKNKSITALEEIRPITYLQKRKNIYKLHLYTII